jgi:hypothetical protein
MDKNSATPIFEDYFRYRLTAAEAVLPTEQLAVIRQMRHDLMERGLIPLGIGEVAQFNITHPTYAAILRGESVTVGGTAIQTGRGGFNLQNLSTPAKIGLLSSAFLIPILALGLVFTAAKTPDVTPTLVAISTTEMPPKTPEVEQAEMPLITPTFGGILPPPQVITPTQTPAAAATPAPLANVRGQVAPGGFDPASVEIAGESFILSIGQTQNGVWVPRGPEWLLNSIVRPVIALPHNILLAAKLQQLELNSPILLRLRSGKVVTYSLSEVAHYGRDQIETLAPHTPSIVIFLYGAEGNERLVISGVVQDEG